MFWFKSGPGRVIESAAWLLETAVAFGFVAGATIAVAFGKFLLGGALCALAYGIFLRVKRKRAVQPTAPDSSSST